MSDISNNPWAVLAICVFGSGFMICVGAGMSRMLSIADGGMRDPSEEQRLHMSEVRRRYIQMLANEVQSGRVVHSV
jgi:hypothetical protein